MNDSPVCPEGGYLRARTPPGRWGAAAGPRCACRIWHRDTAGRKYLDWAGYPRPSAPPYPTRPLQGRIGTCKSARDTPSATRCKALGLMPPLPPPLTPPLLLPLSPLISASGWGDAEGGSDRLPLFPFGEISGSD